MISGRALLDTLRPQHRARYILTELERTAYRRENGGKERELAPWEDLNLEHVLPRNPGAEWAAKLKADPEFREDTSRLGNMCLLDSGANRQLGSKGFATKKSRLYSSSELLLTHQIAAYDGWDRASVADRQARLADLAVMTWPLPTAS